MRIFSFLGTLVLMLLVGNIAAAAPITFSGSNDYVTPPLPLSPGRLNVDWTCGEGYFSVWLVDASGKDIDLLASQVDSASGSTVTHIDYVGDYLLKVSADSPWTISLPTELQTTTATAFSGSNDKVTPALSLTPGRLNVDWTCGEGYFSVWLVDASGENVDLLASQVDSASGSTVTHISSSGYYMLKVSADSPWTISLPTELQTTTATAFSGSNDKVTPALSLTSGRLNVDWTCGEGYFSVWLVDASGKNVDMLASQVDSGSGSTVTHIPAQGYYMLKVSADSPWTINLPNLQPIQTQAPAPIVTNPPAPAPVVVTTAPVPVIVTPAPILVSPTPTPAPILTVAPISQPVVEPVVTLTPASSWGKRYAVGNPGSYLGSRSASGTAPTGTSTPRVAGAGPTLKPGSVSHGITPPPRGSFVRWYPAERWAAGIN